MKEQKDQYMLDSVNNALLILDLLSEKGELGVADICREMDIGKASAFRLLYTLEKRHFITKTPRAKYKLGIKFSVYGSIVIEQQEIVRLCRPYMEQLRDRHNETVLLSTLTEKGKALFLYKVNPVNSIQLSSVIGAEKDAYCSAGGKALLAQLSRENQERMAYTYHYIKYTKNTIMQAENLLSELLLIKEHGYSFDNEEGESGYSGYAVPIFDYSQKCVAALGIRGVSEQLVQHQDSYIISLREIGRMVSRKMGY